MSRHPYFPGRMRAAAWRGHLPSGSLLSPRTPASRVHHAAGSLEPELLRMGLHSSQSTPNSVGATVGPQEDLVSWPARDLSALLVAF